MCLFCVRDSFESSGCLSEENEDFWLYRVFVMVIKMIINEEYKIYSKMGSVDVGRGRENFYWVGDI